MNLVGKTFIRVRNNTGYLCNYGTGTILSFKDRYDDKYFYTLNGKSYGDLNGGSRDYYFRLNEYSVLIWYKTL